MQEKVSEKVQERIFNVILKRPENLQCADCQEKGPRWVSIDFGVVICMNCAGAHRTLSPKVTRVRSTNIDSWFQDHIDIVEGIGNAVANSYFEYAMPKTYTKPAINASLESLIRFVQDKYLKRLFSPGSHAPDPKTAFLASKQALKPFYFDDQHATNDTQQSADTKPMPAFSGLGDLIDLEPEEFHEFTLQPPVQTVLQAHQSTPEQSLSNVSQQGSYSVPQLGSSLSLSPEKQHHTVSSQTLNLMNLYNAPAQPQTATQSTQFNTNKYASLFKPEQPQQVYYQNPAQVWAPQQHHQQPQQPVVQPQQPQLAQPNGPVNIMNLYGQQPPANGPQSGAYAGYYQAHSANYPK